ncbi:MAG: FKBP-type peptidyl-prolyl cis-trans isomerase [Bacteroidales bacterium]|nr:FKBP-type peptidyl-prolyl cis-trans isomerase [Bacteroidales bacterium]
MKLSVLIFASLAIAIVSVSACTLEDKISLCVTQEENIESYIANKYADSTVVVSEHGISRVVMVHGIGNPAQAGDSVLFSYQGYTFENGPGNQFAEGTVKSRLGNGSLLSGLDEGMAGMMRGEEAYIIFSARYGFFDQAAGSVVPMTPLIYYVKLEDIYK